ncbi:MAG: hypothetical protein ACOZF2_13705 [Thermodesulfobacteriota bacterium]
MCSCGCQNKEAEKIQPAPQAEDKSYVCYQCNQFKEVPASEPVPECCGKKMAEMD